jgi:transcriptional regulator with XRE-family HTH domain
MEKKKAAKTFKTALRKIRKEKGKSLLALGLSIDSDASHISKIESGTDITLSTMLRLAEALDIDVFFGEVRLKPDPEMRRTRKKDK